MSVHVFLHATAISGDQWWSVCHETGRLWVLFSAGDQRLWKDGAGWVGEQGLVVKACAGVCRSNTPCLLPVVEKFPDHNRAPFTATMCKNSSANPKPSNEQRCATLLQTPDCPRVARRGLAAFFFFVFFVFFFFALCTSPASRTPHTWDH